MQGEKIGEAELRPEVFELKADHDLMYRVAVIMAGNKRRATAHTKVRSEVRGGGRKPWKQKGTGNARTGSIRNPIFRGGGIIFGPRNTANYTRKINKKQRRKAFLMGLSSKAADKELRVMDNWSLDKPNSKKVAAFMEKIKVKGKSALLVSGRKDVNLKRSLKNVGKANYRMAADLNTLDLLNNKYLFLDKESVEFYNRKYSTKAGPKPKIRKDAKDIKGKKHK